MTEFSVDEILEGILKHDAEVLEYIYRSFYQQIKFFVKSNSGTEDDAEDIYQEALIIIYRKLKDDELEITDCSFNTYLYSICRLLWLKQLEKKKIKTDLFYDDYQIVDEEDNILQLYEQSDKFKLYQQHFMRLRRDCRKVLELSLEKVPLKEIAIIMGYKSEKYAKKRKHYCKERLIENIKKDPKFKELT